MIAKPAIPISRRRCLFALVGGSALALARTVRSHTVAPTPVAGFELPEPKPLRPFGLEDHCGRTFDNARLAGHWTLLLFGYTHCTDVCPTTLVQMRDARRELARHHPDVPLALLFVTVDPTRDTRARLASYAANFGDHVLAVGGSPSAIRSFADQFKVRYARRAGARAESAYEIDHTPNVALLGPDGRLHAVFTLPLHAERVASDVARMNARAARAPAAAGPDNLRCLRGNS
jgi:protein SCO1/2